ncbi:HNH endonuclease [Pseudoalteromonas sp. SS15]|uniref:HNH endonuclease n=1 Tax=Pseudoalteromonas sp. SS15 TaxID=3139393 RepID=UPI003BAA6A5B
MSDVFNFIDKMPKKIVFTDEEKEWIETLISSDLSHDQIWSGAVNSIGVRRTDRNQLIKKIKDELTNIQEGYCYYCGFKFDARVGELGKNKIEREHIAPKSEYKQFTFQPENLVLACSICNSSNYKGTTDTIAELAPVYEDCAFIIVHPYLDDRSKHLKVDDGGNICVVDSSPHGSATLKMFNLNETFWVGVRATDIMFRKYNVSSIQELENTFLERALQEALSKNHTSG